MRFLNKDPNRHKDHPPYMEAALQAAFKEIGRQLEPHRTQEEKLSDLFQKIDKGDVNG